MNNPMMTLVYLNIAGAKESRRNKSRNSRAWMGRDTFYCRHHTLFISEKSLWFIVNKRRATLAV